MCLDCIVEVRAAVSQSAVVCCLELIAGVKLAQGENDANSGTVRLIDWIASRTPPCPEAQTTGP